MIDADVVDTVVTAEEWMQLNNIIQRIDSDVDVSPSNIKPDTPPTYYINVPLPVSIPITHIHHVPFFRPFCITQRPSMILPPIPKSPREQTNNKQRKVVLKTIRKREVCEEGKDKNGVLQIAKVADRVTNPKLLPITRAKANDLPNITVAGDADAGIVPKACIKRTRGERGPDNPNKKRRPRSCKRCVRNKDKVHPLQWAMSDDISTKCKGRGKAREDCEFWNADDTMKVW